MSKIIHDFRRPPRRSSQQSAPQTPATPSPVPARRMIDQIQRPQPLKRRDIPQKPPVAPLKRPTTRATPVATQSTTTPPQPATEPKLKPELEQKPAPIPEQTATPAADNTPQTPRRRTARKPKLWPPKLPHIKLPFKLSKKRWILIIAAALIVIIAGVIGYLNYTASKITDGGSLIDLITPGAKLATDSQGRTNILVFGTSHDDADHKNALGGGGLWLTDSIMLVSLNQANNTAKMVSVPRDLLVKIEGECSVGTVSKINAVYECASDLVNQTKPGANYKAQDKRGADALKKKITEVTGITPQYFAHVNYSVLKEAVDAVGGIDVEIKGDGASGIYDTNFDWNCGDKPAYSCKHVYYPKDGTYTLSGTQALYLARARADAGKYSYKNFGLARGDFDRQINQQKILTALKQKAQSAGVLSNPIKVFSLINALGNNITTDLTTSEMKTIASALQKLPDTGIESVDLAGDTPVVETGFYSAQSIVQATSGQFNYASIIQRVAKKLSTNPATSEEATIAVFNGGQTAGAAGKLQTTLASAGLDVALVGNTTAVGTAPYTVYVTEPSSFPKTISYLTQHLTGASVISTAEPSSVPANTADIVIVINK